MSAKIAVFAKPNAKSNKLIGVIDDVLHVAIAAPPTDGKANIKLCLFLAEILDVPKSAVKVVHGESSRRKMVEVEGWSKEQVWEKCSALLANN